MLNKVDCGHAVIQGSHRLLDFGIPAMNSKTDNPEIHNNALELYSDSSKMLDGVDCVVVCGIYLYRKLRHQISV